jgi:hypothetical protein
MYREDIIRMAREAGGLIYEVDWCFEMENLERFFQAAYAAGAAAEREACASICFQEGPSIDGELIAEAIRARGNT